ncbi:MAG: hypothetical protein ACJAUP_002831 [Cellvibrionaceae bacterium]|jgi:hypothetical protein
MTSHFIKISTKTRVTTKILVLFLGAMINQACTNQADVRQEFLTESVLSTSFTAVVSHKKVTKLSSNANDGDEYELSAEVINPISGKEQKVINYRMFVEPGEEVVLNQEPVIIFLCESKGQHYWPGVGAEFPATEAFIKTAGKAAKMKSSQSPTKLDSHCEN